MSIYLVDVLTAGSDGDTDYLVALMCGAEEWLAEADAVIVYSDAGWSAYLTHLIEAARHFELPIEFRSLDMTALAGCETGGECDSRSIDFSTKLAHRLLLRSGI